MAPTLIANMLVIATQDKSGGAPTPEYMGVEFSQPLRMDGAAIATLTGTVQDLTRTAEHCDAEIQGSNDQMRWFPVATGKLPDAPGPFVVNNVAVDYAWVRGTVAGCDRVDRPAMSGTLALQMPFRPAPQWQSLVESRRQRW